MTEIRKQRTIAYAVFTAPAVLVYGSIIIFPVIYSFSLSFFQWTGFGAPEWTGLSNYSVMFSDQVFRHGLRNNLLVVAVSIFGQMPLGFLLAYILYRGLVKAGRFFETMIFLPITIAAVVVALLWAQIFSPTGLFTTLIQRATGNPRFVLRIFESRTFAIVPVLFVILWMYTGMYMVIYLANLQKISPSVIESAIIDGASESQILFRIVTPAMINILFTTAVFAISGSLKSFDLIWAMTQGGPANYTTVIAIYMYITTFKYYRYGFGSAVSVVIIVLSLGLITLAQRIYRYFENRYE